MRSSRRSWPDSRATLSRLVVATAVIAAAAGLTACGSAPLNTKSGAVPPAPTIEDAWVGLPMGASGMTAAYMTIHGASVDTKVIQVSSPVAASVSLHLTTTGDSGMTGMRPVPEILIPANSTVQLAPGGYHVMLEGLRATLAVGQFVQLDVAFDTGVTETVQAEVRAG